jgi:hypothetical protein
MRSRGESFSSRRAESYMKREISMLFVVLCFSACAEVRKDWVITGVNQSEGIVDLSYHYREFEEPHTEDAQAQVVANSACHEWKIFKLQTFWSPDQDL